MLCLETLLDTPFTSFQTTFDVLRNSLVSLLGSNLTILVTFANHIFDKPDINLLPKDVREDLLNTIAESMTAAPIYAGTTVDGVPSQRFLKSRSAQTEPHASAKVLSEFTKHMYKQQRWEIVCNMLVNLVRQMSSARISDLDTIYIPFLHMLFSRMILWRVPLYEEEYVLLFQTVLCQYFERFVRDMLSDHTSQQYKNWRRRALTARKRLYFLDSQQFEEILGSRYTTEIEPIMKALASV